MKASVSGFFCYFEAKARAVVEDSLTASDKFIKKNVVMMVKPVTNLWRPLISCENGAATKFSPHALSHA